MTTPKSVGIFGIGYSRTRCGLRSPVPCGYAWGISERTSSISYPYVFVAGPNKHDDFDRVSDLAEILTETKQSQMVPIGKKEMRHVRNEYSPHNIEYLHKAFTYSNAFVGLRRVCIHNVYLNWTFMDAFPATAPEIPLRTYLGRGIYLAGVRNVVSNARHFTQQDIRYFISA